MSTESQVMALLREGDPARELPDMAPSGPTAAAYLDNLEQRSSEVTQMDVQPNEATRSNRPWWWGAAAAAVIVGLGVTLVVVTRDDDPVVNDPVSTTVPQVSPTTLPETVPETVPTTVPESVPPTTAAAPTTTLDAAEAAWQAITPWILDGSGDFRTDRFDVPFSFSTGEPEWAHMFQQPGWMYLQTDGVEPEEAGVGIDIFTVDETIDSVVQAWVAAHDALDEATMSEPVAASVGSAEGVRFETSGLPRNTAEVVDADVIPYAADDGGVPGGPDGYMYVVNVDGQTVVLAVNTDVVGADAAARTLIDSIVWKALR